MSLLDLLDEHKVHRFNDADLQGALHNRTLHASVLQQLRQLCAQGELPGYSNPEAFIAQVVEAVSHRHHGLQETMDRSHALAAALILIENQLKAPKCQVSGVQIKPPHSPAGTGVRR